MCLNKQVTLKGSLLVITAGIFWGFDGIVLTPNLHALNVAYVVFMLHLLPTLVLTLVWGKKEIKNILKMNNKTIVLFLLIALFGGALGTLSIVKALFLVNFQHLTIVTLLQKLQPIFAIILASILLKEKIGKKFIAYGFLALIGGYFLTFQNTLPSMSSPNIIKGSFYAILAAFSFGISTVLGKKALINCEFKTAVYVRYLFTTLILGIIVAINGGFLDLLSKTTLKHWIIFVIIGMTSGTTAIYLYYKGLRFIKASIATMCELSFPISAIIFDFIFNQKMLSLIQFISAGIMIFAIYMINRDQNEKLEN